MFTKNRNFNYTALLLTFIFVNCFFSIRKLIKSSESYIIGQFSDFTTISLYLSDFCIILLALIIFALKYKEKEKYRIDDILYLIFFWLIIELFFVFPISENLLIYYSLRLILLILASYETVIFLKRSKVNSDLIFKFFLFFTTFESFLAIIQFITQKSVGLYLLGESHIGPEIIGTSNIVVSGAKFIRSYGTFTHPNVLGAFLCFGILTTLYFYTKSSLYKEKLALLLISSLNFTALVLTFSRSAYLAYLIGFIVFSSVLYLKEDQKNRSLKNSLIILLLSQILIFLLFRGLILPRSSNDNDGSIKQRVELNTSGFKMIRNNWFWGVGAGQSLLHMEQYSGKKLEIWEKQPIHNFYLLTWAEIGLPGLLLILGYLTKNLWSLMKKVKKNFSGSSLLLFTILMCSMILMFFDHYFYTLNQPSLFLWLLLGLVSFETQKASS